MKKLKDCPYFRIQEIEAHIERKKQILTYVQEEVMQYEKALMQSDIKQLRLWSKICYDGFSGSGFERQSKDLKSLYEIEKQEILGQKKPKCACCPYESIICQDLLAFKESRLLFLSKKIRELNAYYNQLVNLAHAICNKFSLLIDESLNQLVVFYNHPIPSLVCFNCADFKPLQSGRFTYEVIYYDEKTLQVEQKELAYIYEVASTALEGTYLGDGTQAIKLIKIEFPEEKIEALEEAILNGVYMLTKKLNQTFKRRYGPIRGLYIELPQRVTASQIGFKRRIEKLGYQSLGKVNQQGTFEKDRLLVYLCKSGGK